MPLALETCAFELAFGLLTPSSGSPFAYPRYSKTSLTVNNKASSVTAARAAALNAMTRVGFFPSLWLNTCAASRKQADRNQDAH